MTAPTLHAPSPELERRRRAPRARPDDDTRRGRGWAAGAGAAAALALVLGWATAGGAPRAPAPLSRPHRDAGLTCASCHGVPASGSGPHAVGAMTSACVGCHGPHPSQRAGHRRLAATGELTCVQCHAGHAHEGLTLAPGAAPVAYFPGGERRLAPVAAAVASTTHVPVPRVAACAACHDAKDPRDALAPCLPPAPVGSWASGPGVGGTADAAGRPIACFDEHHAVGTTVRDAAWDAARAVVWREPVAEPAARRLAQLGAGLALPFVLGLAVVAWVQRRRREQEERRARALLPAAPGPTALRRLPVIDPGTCLGCHACVDACPYDVLEVQRFVAVLSRPDLCCGLTTCEQACPNGSLVMKLGGVAPSGPPLTERLEARRAPGVYLAGDLAGGSLIRTAVRQGATVAAAVAEDLASDPRRAGDPDLDLLVVGAGPAGLAAGLAALQAGLSVRVVEQSTMAAGIRSFPRAKLVLDHAPGDEALVLPVEQCTKEELLVRWQRVVRRAALPLHEHRRVTAVERDAGGRFHRVTCRDTAGASSVTGSPPASASSPEASAEVTLVARRVVLAAGRRGSPRRLSVPLDEEAEARVHLALVDARSFAGQRVVVVGLGDVAMEAALALAAQPGTHVTVIHRGTTFRRGRQRTIDQLVQAAAGGRLRLVPGQRVTAIESTPPTADHPLLVHLQPSDQGSPAGRQAASEAPALRGADDAAARPIPASGPAPTLLPADAVFVLLGAIPPRELLRAAGVLEEGDPFGDPDVRSPSP